ncbi:NAD(P)-binding domain-containing protein [Methylobacillus arboreus]|uniref:NAD(P)-binding domain-containing protein n=1 Tax=Methylobacillus arboreus TaxID=755170 RepID=UPI001E64BAEB|nr:NAD(P)-binding domain-containing protein [Methylobacillus arboreus]MCB5190914.1 NAD(P)-binding domain-containing protein [Methylobacillus arboreus]
MSSSTEITIVGAGPYGLSIAAHLKHLGLGFRIVGSPMHTWRTHMPKGMHLKSAGLSATLFDPERKFSLKDYCRQHGLPYEDEGLPISLELFTQYGMAFQQRFAPQLEEAKLVSLQKLREGFELTLDNGERFTSGKVVLAVGIDYFRYVPAPLKSLHSEHYSHSAEHHDLAKFAGKDVAIIGSGSSAIDMAVLLNEVGARPTLVARRKTLNFNQKEGRTRGMLSRLLAPMSGLGPGWKNLLCASAPGLFRYLPDQARIRITKDFLGPSGAWFIQERLDKVPVMLGQRLFSASSTQDKASLYFVDASDKISELEVDHVVAATGYKADLGSISFLSPEIRLQMRTIGNTPRLSANFESSVPGIYFAGPSTANNFGPLMRFALGAGYTSRKLTRHLFQTTDERGNVAGRPQAAVSSQYQP